jgi:GNAT superfamily N-acetyltransferase
MAIRSDWRSQGVGSRVFRKLAQVVAMPIVVDVAPPEEGADALRRIAFYRRMGFGWNEGEYLAPAYEPGKNAKAVRFMSWPGSLSARAFDQVRDTINDQVYGQALLPWPPLVMAS